jgi:hypothetical protein
VGREIKLVESSSINVDNGWPEASAIVEDFTYEGVLVTTDHGHLQAAAERAMFSSGGHDLKKRKKASRRGSTSGKAPC